MKLLCWPSVASMLLVSALPAQTRNIAERLGHPADAKLLILHADDLGAAHSVDAATFDALDRGAISSASIMMPTPWVTEVAAYSRAHPNADLGLHLTLTSEWQSYRWGSVESKDKVPSLLDAAGTFPNETEPVARKARPAEIERELRAQIERALALGIHPTHLDSHMAALFTTPELAATYVKVAHDYQLPFLALRTSPRPVPLALLSEKDVVLDALVSAGAEVPRDQWKAFYLNAIANLKPGLTEMIVHLGHDDAELQAVTVNHEPWGSAWRQRDYDVVTSPEFKKALQDHHVILVTYRDLHRAARRLTPGVGGAGLGNHEPNISPNSKWLAYTSSDADAPNVFVVEVAHPENRYQLSVDGGTEPVWASDGKSVTYVRSGKLVRATLSLTPRFEVIRRDLL